MKRLLLILLAVTLLVTVLIKNEVTISKSNLPKPSDEIYSVIPQKSDKIPVYTPSYEPPPHPLTAQMFEKIDKTSLNFDDLNWVLFSKVYEDVIDEYPLDIDFLYPNNYYEAGYQSSTFLKWDGPCIVLRGKEERMFEFCATDDGKSINMLAENLLTQFRTNSEEITFKGKRALHRISSEDSIFPKEEILIVDYDSKGNVERAYRFRYPMLALEDYAPENPTEWEQYRDGYIMADVPIAKKVLDSFTWR